MPVRDHYQNALQEIMLECGIHRNSIGNPNYHIEEYTTFPEVVRYTEYHIGETHDQRSYFGRRNEPHFRYNRYRTALRTSLRDLPVHGRRIVHLDIGCGSGLFSWVLLDWATENEIELDRVDLYGYDHSPAMIRLAERMKDKLAVHIIGYPDIRYCSSPSELSRQLSENHQDDTDYIITFGYVLVQAYSSSEIQKFTQAITSVTECMDGQSNCALVAVDSGRQVFNEDRTGIICPFDESWSLLLEMLEQSDVQHRGVSMSVLPNNVKSARAELYP